MASTPLRNIRVADDLWDDARAIAAARDESVTDVLRASLERYVSRNKGLLTPPPAPR